MTFKGLIQRYRRWVLGRKGLHLDRSCYVGKGISIGKDTAPFQGRILVGPECEINQGVELSPFGGMIKIARRVWLGPYVVIYGHGGVEIGEQSLISMHCTILSSNHAIPPKGTLIRNVADELLHTKVGRDCWIGANAVILGGVIIGDGCVVGAGAVVTKNLPAYSIAMGVPARVVRTRG
jgi:acetyltransferase-like isoleucine patch superfamily enzyme